MTPDTPTIDALRRQLQQLQQLHAEGALSSEAYEPRRAALERELLDRVMAGEVPAATAPATTPAAPAPSRRLLWASGVFAVVVAVAGYAWMGSPSLWNQRATGGAADARHTMESTQIAAMVDKLKARLDAQPGDAEGWAMLGRSYMVLGRTADALPAYEKAVALAPGEAPLLADYADALAVKNDRRLEGEPLKWIEKALALDPEQPKALSLAGTAAFDRKDYAGAVQYWERAVRTQPADSPMAQQMRDSIAEARKLAGMPAAATAESPRAAPDAVGAAQVSGTVSLDPALARRVSPDDTVFVFARAAEGPRMPLAIVRKQVKDLPFEFKLDDAMAMSPQARLSGFARVVVGARISKSGNAMAQPGDLQGQTEAVPVGSQGLKVVIGQAVGG